MLVIMKPVVISICYGNLCVCFSVQAKTRKKEAVTRSKQKSKRNQTPKATMSKKCLSR